VKRILGRPTGLWEREPTRRRDVFAFHFENLTRRRLRVLNPVPCGRSCLVQDTLFHYLRVYWGLRPGWGQHCDRRTGLRGRSPRGRWHRLYLGRFPGT